MNFVITVLAFIVALGVLIVFHEFGHYVVAGLFGVKVLRFSIGFGRAVWRIRLGRDQTEWVIAALPLGGYVKMLDEHEAPVAAEELHRAFNRQSVWRRIAIVAAGPVANFLLAIVFYWGLFVGGVQEAKPIAGAPEPGTVAEAAGLVRGETILKINGEPMASWQQVRWRLLQLAVEKQPARLGVMDAKQRLAWAHLVTLVRYAPVAAFGMALERTWETSAFSLKMLGKMVIGQVSWKNLSGPVTIADYAGQSAQLGIGAYVAFLALISISLGVLNLLPIPLLDGGHLLYYVVEIFKGSPVSDRAMELGQRLGLTLLLFLMACAIYNDFNRLFAA